MPRVTDPRLVDAALGAVASPVIRTAPDLLAAVVIVVAGIIIGSVLGSLLRRRVQPIRPWVADFTGRLGYWAVIVIGVLVAATRAGIAVGVLERILLVVVGALALTLTVSVGLGLGSRNCSPRSSRAGTSPRSSESATRSKSTA